MRDEHREKKRREEEERRRREEEQRRLEEEKRRQEEEKRRQEEEKRRQEEEARRKAEEARKVAERKRKEFEERASVRCFHCVFFCCVCGRSLCRSAMLSIIHTVIGMKHGGKTICSPPGVCTWSSETTISS